MARPVMWFEVLGNDAANLRKFYDFRNFRVDRASGLVALDEAFQDEAGKTLRDLLTRYGPEAVKLLD